MTTSSPKAVRQSPQKATSPLKRKAEDSNSNTLVSNQILRPSADELVDLERELQSLISRKIQADTKLVTLENRLYDLETEYLTETQPFGNLIHGVEGYLGLTPSVPLNSISALKRGPLANSNSSLNSINFQSVTISPQQRIFSSTSTTFQKSLALAGRTTEAIANGYVSTNSSEVTFDLTSIRNRATDHSVSHKKSSPTKKGVSKSSTLGTNSSNQSDSVLETAEWQPPPMKSSRKK